MLPVIWTEISTFFQLGIKCTFNLLTIELCDLALYLYEASAVCLFVKNNFLSQNHTYVIVCVLITCQRVYLCMLGEGSSEGS